MTHQFDELTYELEKTRRKLYRLEATEKASLEAAKSSIDEDKVSSDDIPVVTVQTDDKVKECYQRDE
jgi:hypothetical protein